MAPRDQPVTPNPYASPAAMDASEELTTQALLTDDFVWILDQTRSAIGVR